MSVLRPAVEAGSSETARITVERAVGLLAGRARCRLAEARRRLLRMAGEQRCDPADMAVRVTRLLDGAVHLADRAAPCSVEQLVDAALAMPERGDDPGRAPERLAGMEQLANLGWGEWDLVSGEIYWSPQLYRIYERDPELGPMPQEEAERIAVADDRPLRLAALEAFDRAERVDLITRVRIGGRVKHLRTVADAVRDTGGRPLRLYGIVQDVTEQQTGAERLAEVEHQLDEQRRTLAAEHDLAARLQRIILPIPDEPLDLPGLKAAVRYLPAGQETAVGGDWYHAAALRDGSVLLAVGDVAGHGTHAATTMAQLRHALRALAVITSDPGTLLEHLNRLTCELERETPELAATAVIARFDPHRRELIWAQAGHPPPLLSRDGRTAPLVRPSGPMLGVIEDARYSDAVVRIHPADVLLLYTDGLIEHRGRCLDAGLDAVIATVDDAVRVAPHQPLAELLGRLHRANPDDDTCILAARALGGVPRRPVPGRSWAMDHAGGVNNCRDWPARAADPGGKRNR